MTERQPPGAVPFTAAERSFIRQELAAAFGVRPSLAKGIRINLWTSGSRRGEPKIPPVLGAMIERGLIDMPAEDLGQRAYFTQTGLAALKRLYEDGRYLDPDRFGHLREELGIPEPPLGI
ncbi:hypothetical protein ACELLULO517_03400 [Acidisoma cellulosilytica]|uniref:Uncharacterized protein n=1 Tax=Acidisoma cellulosilyticum TaxID=2802395 RepID=A0A963YXZ4_9PROT|nr:hypothetical protein [Acidisoma cellulosilyticum]MCB8879268.1 hypothetical protein [Acidisoma cellulosilyticum]